MVDVQKHDNVWQIIFANIPSFESVTLRYIVNRWRSNQARSLGRRVTRPSLSLSLCSALSLALLLYEYTSPTLFCTCSLPWSPYLVLGLANCLFAILIFMPSNEPNWHPCVTRHYTTVFLTSPTSPSAVYAFRSLLISSFRLYPLFFLCQYSVLTSSQLLAFYSNIHYFASKVPFCASKHTFFISHVFYITTRFI